MDNNIVAQETPLLSENNEITAKKDSEVQIGDSDSGIAFIAQFFHLALACIVFGLSLVYRDEIKVNCIFLLIISSVKLFAFNGPVQGIIIPLEIGFLAVAAVSCMATARIIRISAIQVRGTNRVHDPNHLVPAWHLATLEESQSCRRRKNRQLQLA
ncbi:hypothetical protein JR316_0010225 [Psilocybe cubensis]|uniref:Uncharacterized protein n=1 Tax=Psilocybe cubensis TaxID=181762 RepID=A0ACB8GRE6_PSICU|nr:hypothetical protein JR316_0010225 [Psilocybe cubensis]KAH9477992.1 hypothetical protein JR316_0010225 [Psilocybe cubensis]